LSALLECRQNPAVARAMIAEAGSH